MPEDTKEKVNEAAEDLATALTNSGLGEPLKVGVKDLEDTETGGSKITVATLGRERPRVEVWCDKWLDGESQVYWAGFGEEKRAPVEQIASDYRQERRLSIDFGNNDFERRGGIICLKKMPTAKALLFPILEYYDVSNGFGIYGCPSGPFDVTKATNFIESVIRSLPEYNAPDGYTADENRKTWVWHPRTQRDAELAKRCKVRDGYKCQVCGLLFVEKYGPFGKDFAEAHHIVPLSKLDGPVQTTLADLVTVCANCHRMLDQMEGKQDDINNLRTLVLENRGDALRTE